MQQDVFIKSLDIQLKYHCLKYNLKFDKFNLYTIKKIYNIKQSQSLHI